MKLKRLITFKSKLLILQLLKFKTYIIKENSINLIKIKLIEVHLKQALKIIYNYHINNKKIFFIGIPQIIQTNFQNFLQRTNHLFIPENVWIQGILSNKISILRYIKKQFDLTNNSNKKNKALKSVFQVKTKPDLIVIFNKKSDLNVLQEVKLLQIPVIIVTDTLDIQNLYKIPGNFLFANTKVKNVLFSLIYSLFKKIK